MKKSLMITASILYFASLVTTVNAQTAIPVSNKTTTSTEPLTVQYLGSQDDYLVFRVEIKTGDVNQSVFKIEDAIEGELYSKTIYAGSKYQVVKIEKRDDQVLDFKLVSEKKVYVKTFTTENNTKIYQKGLAVL